MNISPIIPFLLFLFFVDRSSARSGGRGGGGARGGSRGGSRSRGGGKFHSSSSHSYVHYDSSSFRSTVFKPSTSSSYFSTGTTGNTYIINQPATPIIYDNHYYYWHGYYHSRPEKKSVCEYTITAEDGELFNVTFSNGTTPKSLTFGCGSFEECCGMSCCSTVGTWIAVSGSSGGGKYHSSSSHSNYINYDSSSFRSSVFNPSTSKTYFSTGTTTNTFVINQPATPIIYDNHYYYWHGHYHSHPEKKTYCEYAISEEDGELYNVTYENGTRPKYLTFGCGSYEKCCGLSCCSSIGDWMALSIWFLIFFLACCFGSRNN
ncbi:hypothetical protein L5515_008609 [Caenorhabditis briggsae]|uniref:CX domain-containing protein n=1 Tax=Caenorhabditis briggsae TaxID=6238 RepID=A0AAE9F831_CAEBR|nr:hypothetical protein L5515_008609 [Caenorhabditis briggsae]